MMAMVVMVMMVIMQKKISTGINDSQKINYLVWISGIDPL